VEEVEAIRLKDLEGLEQEECAQRMQISRPTFHRVLESARNKLADALLNGKAIRIEGGNFELTTRRFRCGNDGYEWDVPFNEIIAGRPSVCPACQSTEIQTAPGYGFGMRGRGRCRRGKKGW
jgi:predicted Zn-ribbon and HTH transcriptional regulator